MPVVKHVDGDNRSAPTRVPDDSAWKQINLAR
jgi:hypothetical protein